MVLKGTDKIYTSRQGRSYYVRSGKLRVFLAPASSRAPMRQMFLAVAEAGWVVPYLNTTWMTEKGSTTFTFLLVPDGETQVEEIPFEPNQVMFFLNAAKLDYGGAPYSPELLADTLLGLYAFRNAESGRIVRSVREARQKTTERRRVRAENVFDPSREVDHASSGDSESPLYNAFAFLCSMNGIQPVRYEKIRSLCEDRATLSDIARVSGIICREVKISGIRELSSAGRPLLVFCDGAEYPVVVYRRFGRMRCWDPVSGKRKAMKDVIRRGMELRVFDVSRPLPGKVSDVRGIIRYTLKELRFSDIALMLLGTYLATAVSLRINSLNSLLFDDVIPNANGSILNVILICMTAYLIGGLMFNMTKSLSSFRLNSRIRYSLQAALYDRLFHMPESFLRSTESAQMAYRIESLPSLYCNSFEMAVSTVMMIGFSTMYVSQMFSFSPQLAVIGVAIVLVSVTLHIILGRIFSKFQMIRSSKTSELRSFLNQIFASISTVRANGAEEEVQNKYMNGYYDLSRADMDYSWSQRISSAIVAAANSGALVLFFYLLTEGRSNLMTGQFMSFVASFTAFSSSMLTVGGNILMFIVMRPVLSNSAEILSRAPENTSSGVVPSPLEGNIRVSNVSFSYGKGQAPVLNDINMDIKSGELIGIVGPSGCGKSTLLRLLLGFEAPSKGSILYDGIELGHINRTELRRRIGTVLQNGVLFSGSIYKNITISKPDASEEEVIRAAQIADIYDTVEAMPLGFSTIISEDSHTISGGQKQRIMIARAVLNEPRILFLDEATSALDNVSQAKVSESLSRLNATRVMIAHRLSTVVNCDKIYVLDKGRIAESGTYKELMEKKGLFYQLALNQMA